MVTGTVIISQAVHLPLVCLFRSRGEEPALENVRDHTVGLILIDVDRDITSYHWECVAATDEILTPHDGSHRALCWPNNTSVPESSVMDVLFSPLSWPKNIIHVGNSRLSANNPNGSSLLSYRYSNGYVYSAKTPRRRTTLRLQLTY